MDNAPQTLPARALVGAIKVYQSTVSPLLPIFLGPGCGCRFAPSCSHYAADAVRQHGALAGSWFAVRRLAKCTPLHRGGYDPVPDRIAPSAEAQRAKADHPRCHRPNR